MQKIRDRLIFFYLLTAVFGLITFIVISFPTKDFIESYILRMHKHINNCHVYHTIIITSLFIILLSLYDYYIR